MSRFRHDDGIRPAVTVEVDAGDGAWTPGPHVSIEAGNAIELTGVELAWLVEDAGPQALAALRAASTEAEEAAA